MKAQVLYDLREKEEFCSGSDLHEFFNDVTGVPSPSGHVEIHSDKAIEFVKANTEAQYQNNKTPEFRQWKTRVDALIAIAGQ